MKKFVIKRMDTGTYRNNLLIDSGPFDLMPAPAYSKTLDNAAIMSRRLAMDQRMVSEVVVPVNVSIQAL